MNTISLAMNSDTRTIWPHRVNKEFSSKFPGGYLDWQMPEEHNIWNFLITTNMRPTCSYGSLKFLRILNSLASKMKIPAQDVVKDLSLFNVTEDWTIERVGKKSRIIMKWRPEFY